MLPPSFLTQLIPARIAEALRRVEAMIWRPMEAELTVTATTPTLAHRSFAAVRPEELQPLPRTSFAWGPKYAQRWFRVQLPNRPAGQSHLEWRDQAEATVYVEGVPYAGLDLAHPRCALPDGATEIWIESACVKTGIWLDGRAPALGDDGSLYAPPALFTRDEQAWQAFHDLRVLLDVLEVEYADFQPGARKAFTDPVRHTPAVWRASPLFRRWCARLERAVDAFDAEGLPALAAELAQLYTDFPAARGELDAVLTGHAHIDLVWLWPEAVGTFKTIHTWATQVRLLEAYPEFRFGFSQPAAYDAVAARAPALSARVRELIRAGRWEATGGSYVECDTQLPCGEGLVRCLRLGQQRFRALRGGPARVFWLPDVFGYTAALPQLLRGFGLTGFFTTKLSWSSVNRFPHSSFRWRGSDGSEVSAHVVLLHDYNEAVGVRNLREDALHHQQAAVHPEFLVPTGYGDGGGGPTEAMCERARRLADLAGAPRVRWGGIEDFFARLEKITPQLPVVAGELPLELHRGVFTTHGRLKAAFRGLERSLQLREAVHAASGSGPIPAGPWERMAFTQFHDYIPGSSIWEVYAEGVPELERLGAEARAAAGAALDHTGGPGAWFNPLPLPRTWIDGEACVRLPPLAGAPTAALVPADLSRPEAGPTQLRSERVRADFDRDGRLAGLEIDGRAIALRGPGHHLAAYPDHPAMFEAWDIDRATLVHPEEAVLQGEPRVHLERHQASVTFDYRLGSNRVAVVYSVRADEPVLRLRYEVDWTEPERLLKAVFSTDYLGRHARFGTPFGSVLRGQAPGYEREEALWEVPASRWMVVLDDAQSEGLAILTEAKYGFSVRDGVAGVSLLRSALVTEADAHAQIRTTPDRPRHSDLGHHTLELALAHFTPDLPRHEQPAALADLLFTPCLAYHGGAVDAGLAAITGGESLVPTWAEPTAAGRWTLRLHETLGRRGTVRLQAAPSWSLAVAPLDGGPETATVPAKTAAITFRPYEVISVAFIHA